MGVDVERCTCWVVEQQTTVACSTVQQQSFFVVTTKKFFFSHTTVPWFLGLLWCAKTTVLLLRDTNSGLDTTQHSCFFFGVSWCTGCFSSSSFDNTSSLVPVQEQRWDSVLVAGCTCCLGLLLFLLVFSVFSLFSHSLFVIVFCTGDFNQTTNKRLLDRCGECMGE